MAKKKGGGGPQKTCPECQKKVHAATKTCECGHVFPPRAGKKAKSGSGAGEDYDRLAMEYVLFNQGGNFDKALKAVESYKEDSLAQFIRDCGGADKAKATLEGLAARAAK